MLPFKGKYPKLDPKSHAMPGAELAGDVELKEYASVWQNVSARGDVNKIVVGRYSNVQDNSVLHVDDDHACILWSQRHHPCFYLRRPRISGHGSYRS